MERRRELRGLPFVMGDVPADSRRRATGNGRRFAMAWNAITIVDQRPDDTGSF